MKANLDSFISVLKDPISLAIGVLLLSIVISTAGMSLGWVGFMETYQLFPWMISAAMLLYYSFFTAIILMVTPDSGRDWGRAIYGFMGFVVLSSLYAWFLSGKSIYEAQTYQSIYIVLTLAFFVFLSIGTSVKAIVDFTNKRDAQMSKDENPQKNNQL
ncbi:MAG: hypothetical protein GVX96_06685 [Bacteroidetes bacterium]|jgi:hypothetical protein|nr:hypothetical protein [Bacteroidota bacterium]